MEKLVIDGIAGLKALAGKSLGASQFRTLKFEDIVRFADATGDHQWIHVDRERAKRESPFGVPVAHGYFSLSSIAGLFFELVEARGFALVVNYGLNKVRFPAPLKEGARYRLACRLLAVTEIPAPPATHLPPLLPVHAETTPPCP